jgi:hypothetical protein
LTKYTPKDILYNMKRYQIYLNPHSVSILDEYGKHTDISRSRLIQMGIDQLAHTLRKVFIATKTPSETKYILDSLIGAVNLTEKKRTNVAENIDDIYLRD